MLLRGISRWLAALCLVLAWPTQNTAAITSPIRIVVSFSILGDIVRQIGAGDVAVTSLIGPDSDAHVFEPSPDRARLLAQAQLFVINGLGFEGWLTRLIRSACARTMGSKTDAVADNCSLAIRIDPHGRHAM